MQDLNVIQPQQLVSYPKTFFKESVYSFIGIGQARPQLQTTLMQRMTDVLSRMLNDPMTRAALSAGGEDSLDQENQNQEDSRDSLNTAAAAAQAIVNAAVTSESNSSNENNNQQVSNG